MSDCPNCGRPHPFDCEVCPDCQGTRDGDPSQPEPGSIEPRDVARPGEDQPARFSPEELAVDAKGDPARVPIARFQNGAEVGFFADELTRETGIETEVLAREKFDAVHAVWSIDYLLLVDRGEAERGARALQALVESTGGEMEDQPSETASACDIPGGVWVPLILTLAAGSIACFGIERADQHPRAPALVVGHARRSPEVWQFMGAARGNWVQPLEGGPGVRELVLAPEKGTAVLREDEDGDGRFEREQRFSLRRH